MTDAEIETKDTKVRIAEKVFDHGVDTAAIIGITAAALNGAAEPGVIAGLVSIAVGKRVTDYAGRKGSK